MENEDKGRKNEVLGNRGDVSDGPVIRKLWFRLFHQQSNIVQGHFFCFFFFFFRTWNENNNKHLAHL